MFGALYSADSTLFRWVNNETSNGLFDAVMPFVTEPRNPFLFIPLLALAAFALWRYRSTAAWCIALLAVTIAITDQFNSRIVKNAVGRERPCRALADVRLLKPCGGGRSFPSSHAVNIFAAAVVVGCFFRRTWPYGLALASTIAYSRVYIGVHYPADVLCGAALGAGIAWLVVWLWRTSMARWGSEKRSE